MLGTKGKTTYNFPLTTDIGTTKHLIEDWLSANNFHQSDESPNVYQSGDKLLTGLRFFEYTISNKEIAISAYLGSIKKPIALNDGFVGALPVMDYKNSLAPLFAALSSNNQPTTNQEPTSMSAKNTDYNNFQQSVDKRKTTCAEISFWISILLLLVSFGGVSMSAILIIVNYYLAAQGLKTNKRGKSIAAIVMTSISIVILIIGIIISA